MFERWLGMLWIAMAGIGVGVTYQEPAPLFVQVWFVILIVMGMTFTHLASKAE